METIRKKICLDDFLSHRPGIMPYCEKDSENSDIIYINSVGAESNYGSFVCDFVLIDSFYHTDSTGLTSRKNTELDRLRYIDIINRYNRYVKEVNKGVVLRRINYSITNTAYLDCENPENSIEHHVSTYRWVTTGVENATLHQCCPIPSYLLIFDDNSNYFCKEEWVEERSALQTKLDNGDELTEEEQEKLDTLIYFLGNGDDIPGVLYENGIEYIILVDNYDEFMKYESTWNEWWENAFQQCDYYSNFPRWENAILDQNYTEPQYFKFIYDVEKYILGRIRVPERVGQYDIEGSKVPNMLYYMSYDEYLNWFNENSSNVSTDNELRKIWDNLGGQPFYDFLNTISPIFLKDFSLPEVGDFVGIVAMPPNIEIPLLFIDEAIPEGTYKPYDISVDVNSNIVDGTSSYEVAGNGKIGSALTPTFKEYEEGDIRVESRLSSIESENAYHLTDKIYGILNEFAGGSKLFECAYRTGISYRPEKIKYYTTKLYEYGKRGGEWTVVREVDIPEKMDSVTQTEILPHANETAYQTVGVELINSTTTTGNSSTVELSETFSDGVSRVTSAFTYYTKTTTNTYSWWSCKEVGLFNHSCGDGENIDFSTSPKYRNILLLSCVPNASEGTTGKYYYMVKYENGFVNVNGNTVVGSGSTCKLLTLPYELNKKKNIMSFEGEFSGTVIYDELLSQTTSTDESGKTFITFEYVMGATEGEDVATSGIHYKEKYPYTGVCKEIAVIDNLYKGEVLYQKIDMSGVDEVYSEDYNLKRNALISNIMGMEISTQWTSASCVNAYLFTEDASDNLAEYPDVNVDISYNRGNSAVFEKRFKLAECNTLEDLENYGNNYFNI